MSRAVLAALVLIASCACGQGTACNVGDDGFDTGCCNLVVQTQLPSLTFPAISMQADYAVVINCMPAVASQVQVQLGAPSWVFPDYALASVVVAFPAPGNQMISGTLVEKYARTWTDVSAMGQTQVWRFLVNGDLFCQGANPASPCASRIPPCSLVAGPTVHFDGHLDYACDPSAPGGFTVSLSLSHHVGSLAHAPGSCVPLSGTVAHAFARYHLVAPSPFFFGPVVEPQGPLSGDSVRSSHIGLGPAPTYQCGSEQKLGAMGALTTVLDASCFAGPSPCGGFFPCLLDPPGCNHHQALSGIGCCLGPPSNPFFTVPLAGTPLAPAGLLAFTLGSWSGQGRYPWSGTLTVYLGLLGFQDPCMQAASSLHVVAGVGISNVAGQTMSSTPGCVPAPVASTAFMDLNNVLPLTAGFPAPGYGRVSASDLVFNLNLP